jgi:hypothetical protein
MQVLRDLDVPIAAIIKQAKGDKDLELRLAASFGFRQACQDLANKDHFAIKNGDH